MWHNGVIINQWISFINKSKSNNQEIIKITWGIRWFKRKYTQRIELIIIKHLVFKKIFSVSNRNLMKIAFLILYSKFTLGNNINIHSSLFS